MELKLAIPSHSIVKRIAEPLLLGVSANIAVNYIVNPGSNKFIAEEFLAAIVLAIPITALNRCINKTLEGKIPWTQHPLQRLAAHFGLVLICLLVLLNGPGIGYMWITQKGFFTMTETIIINLVTLSVAALLTFVQWAVYFYRRWVHAESNVSVAAKIIENLKQQLILPAQEIAIQKGTTKINMEARAMRVVRLVFGTVRVYSDNGLCGTFPGSVTQLYALLPGHVFFHVSRDAIIHKQTIESITPAGFGKITVRLHKNYSDAQHFTVSRPKAAAFRKWYNSNPASKQ